MITLSGAQGVTGEATAHALWHLLTAHMCMSYRDSLLSLSANRRMEVYVLRGVSCFKEQVTGGYCTDPSAIAVS